MDSQRGGWADVVKMRRKHFRMNQAQLAEAAGVSLKTVTNVETSGPTPRPETMRKITDALGLPTDLAAALDLTILERFDDVADDPMDRPDGIVDFRALRNRVAHGGAAGWDVVAVTEMLVLRLAALEERVALLERQSLSPARARLSEPVPTLSRTRAALIDDEPAGAPEE